ncbi:hypothetical protein GGI26_000078 [Coemansia sp. RSA 1358]|uniref:Dynactin subunit 6 n=1 Tax=Coemansia umbellata TaxID=1424467 RepID=A0ABQ8PW27_9FUNG|nr:hypothetical protein EDC05_000139 [Coemansia umbellata]KAJ2625994.1 hypothetical protein GGI26_000078 [Coemansia sp. RSA 1358]
MGRLKIAPQALVCKNTTIEGDVQIGNGTVVHVGASILARKGPIIIGSNNIICERATIINNHSAPLTIGDENLIETDVLVAGRGMGHRNVVQVRGKVAGSSTLGNNCVVGATCTTDPDENVPDNTVLFGSPQSRRTRADGNTDHISTHKKHLEYIHEMLPRYNHIVEAE